MSGGARLLLMATAALLSHSVWAGNPRIAHSQYVYMHADDSGTICVYGSFVVSFDIFFEDGDLNSQIPHRTVYLPNNTAVNISGSCSSSQPELVIKWRNNTNSLTMTFGRGKGKWKLNEVTLKYNLSDFNSSIYHGTQIIHTNGSDLFKRKFKTNEYFYCEHCKTYKFQGYNESACGDECQQPCVNHSCSSIHMDKSVIYVGDPSKADKRLCLEDYIALQEIIVPIAVGGVLALLLILIFVAYIIAYVRRRRREAKSQYEPVGDF